MKTCKGCGETKPLGAFSIARKARDGHQWRCKDCNKIERLRRNRGYAKRRQRSVEWSQFSSWGNQRWTVDEETGCWLWLGCDQGSGYGSTYFQGRTMTAHKASWISFHKQEVPDGHQLHHICGTRACVNPEHLQAVTPAEHCRLHGRAKKLVVHIPLMRIAVGTGLVGV